MYTTYRILTLVSYIGIYVYRYPLNDLTHSSTHRQEFYMVLTQLRSSQPRFYCRLRRKGLFVPNTIDDCPQQIEKVPSTTRSHNELTNWRCYSDALFRKKIILYLLRIFFTPFHLLFKTVSFYPGRN